MSDEERDLNKIRDLTSELVSLYEIYIEIGISENAHKAIQDMADAKDNLKKVEVLYKFKSVAEKKAFMANFEPLLRSQIKNMEEAIKKAQKRVEVEEYLRILKRQHFEKFGKYI